MPAFEEIDTRVRQMLAEAGRMHPATEPALIALSLATARELRSEPRWRNLINHAQVGADQTVPTYLGTPIYEDASTARPWLVLTTSEAEKYLREHARLGEPKAAALRAFFISRLQAGCR